MPLRGSFSAFSSVPRHSSVHKRDGSFCVLKIQSATGQKPTEFMRTIRLRRAAELLREGRQSVTEVSYAAGFSSVSYFSRCFRTMYGVPPTQFGKTTTAEVLSPNENPS